MAQKVTLVEGNAKQRNRSKRRLSANKKERQRTLFLNSAFLELREHLPNVPPDTKLPKIKILMMAMNYIRYLENIIAREKARTMRNEKERDIKSFLPTIRAKTSHRSKYTFAKTVHFSAPNDEQ